MKATVIVLASWLEDLILRLISYIRVFTHARSSGQSHDSNSRSGGSENKKKCPFEVLGLEGGEDNTTMEEAIKARRKLALKRHPDRNPGNDEATKMMQEINDAFQKVERILTANREAKVGQFECTDDESDYEEMTGAQKRKYKQKQQKQQRDKEREFKRKAQEEFAKFTRAQKNAARGNYQSTTTYSSNESKSNNSRKKVTKSAKKKGRKGANRNDAQCQHFVNENKQAESKISSFDHFSPEKRCEMKFNSTDLPKMPIFNGATFVVLFVYCSHYFIAFNSPPCHSNQPSRHKLSLW
jgi:curved DNA-binding protein CbpA